MAETAPPFTLSPATPKRYRVLVNGSPVTGANDPEDAGHAMAATARVLGAARLLNFEDGFRIAIVSVEAWYEIRARRYRLTAVIGDRETPDGRIVEEVRLLASDDGTAALAAMAERFEEAATAPRRLPEMA